MIESLDGLEVVDDVPGLPRRVVRNSLQVLNREDAIWKVDPRHWRVASLRFPERRVRVYRHGARLRCGADRKATQLKPCCHILAVLIYEGAVEHPSKAALVPPKQGRDHALEEEAWWMAPKRVPALLAQLLRAGVPVLLGSAPREITGRPPAPLHALVYQAVMRMRWRQGHRMTEDSMWSPRHLEHNPYGPMGASTLSRFLCDPATSEILQKLLALSSWPARDHEALIEPRHTEATTLRFTLAGNNGGPGKRRGPVLQALWTPHYALIAAAYVGQARAAPTMPALAARAKIMLKVEYPDEWQGAARTGRSASAEARGQFMQELVGDQVYSRAPVAQRNEVLCMCIAYNLSRLVYLEVERGVEANFEGGAHVLAGAEWIAS